MGPTIATVIQSTTREGQGSCTSGRPGSGEATNFRSKQDSGNALSVGRRSCAAERLGL